MLTHTRQAEHVGPSLWFVRCDLSGGRAILTDTSDRVRCRSDGESGYPAAPQQLENGQCK